MVRALAPFLPGQTLAQLPQPVQSRTETVMANFMPGMPVMSMVSWPAGAFAASSAVMATGRMTAWGQT